MLYVVIVINIIGIIILFTLDHVICSYSLFYNFTLVKLSFILISINYFVTIFMRINFCLEHFINNSQQILIILLDYHFYLSSQKNLLVILFRVKVLVFQFL